MFDDKLQMNSKLIYDVFFCWGGVGAPVQAGVRRSAPVQAGVRPECAVQAGVRPECAHTGRSAPGVRPCRPECARSAPVQAGVRPERASMSQ